MTAIQLIGVPFDLHRPGVRMGATPRALLPRLLALPLPRAGDPVLVEPAQLTGEPEADLALRRPSPVRCAGPALAARCRSSWAGTA